MKATEPGLDSFWTARRNLSWKICQHQMTKMKNKKMMKKKQRLIQLLQIHEYQPLIEWQKVTVIDVASSRSMELPGMNRPIKSQLLLANPDSVTNNNIRSVFVAVHRYCCFLLPVDQSATKRKKKNFELQKR